MSIADKITRLQTAKSAIATAITAKGGTVSVGDGFEDFAAAIADIPSGGATEPYIEETYNASGELTSARMVGHTKIRDYAFYLCTKLVSVELPSGLISIGTYAFSSCSSLALTELPSGLTSIGDYAFQNCSSLALTELPSGLKSIGSNAFQSCKSLALTTLPSVTNIGSYAFRDCTSLTTLTFNAKLNALSTNAFDGCTNLRDIYVPWGQGEVPYAPWGASNATVHYDYVPTV